MDLTACTADEREVLRAWSRLYKELRGLLNAGHRRSGVAYRCVGEGTRQVVVEFPAFAAVALAGLGNLPDTILTRSVVIRMRRRASGLPAGKTFDAWEPDRCAIPAKAQRALRTLEWIDRAEVLCVCGPSGTGKSHFVEALGHLAIDKGKTVVRRRRKAMGPRVVSPRVARPPKG